MVFALLCALLTRKLRRLGCGGSECASRLHNLVKYLVPVNQSSVNFLLSNFCFVGLRLKHQQELEKLTLISQPFKTLKLFLFSVVQYLRKSFTYLLSHGGWLVLLSAIVGVAAILLVVVDGPHVKVNKIIYWVILYWREN